MRTNFVTLLALTRFPAEIMNERPVSLPFSLFSTFSSPTTIFPSNFFELVCINPLGIFDLFLDAERKVGMIFCSNEDNYNSLPSNHNISTSFLALNSLSGR